MATLTSKAATKALLLEMMGNREPYNAVKTWRYALNLMKSTSHLAPMAYQICGALEQAADKMTMKLSEEWTKPEEGKQQGRGRYENYGRGPRQPVDPAHWNAAKATLQENLDAFEGEPLPVPALIQNMDVMARALEFDANSRDTLELLCLRSIDAGFSQFIESLLNDDMGSLIEAMPGLFDRPQQRAEMNRIFDVSGPLIKYGFVTQQGSRNGRPCMPVLEESLVSKVSTPGLTADEVVGRILGTTVTTNLNLSDFQHLGKKLDFIVRRIKAAIAKRENGVNILLYGEPGVGKTELAAVLAFALGLKLYGVGEERERPVTAFYEMMAGIGQIRIGELLRAQGLLRKSTESMLMFDEFEDLLIKGGDSDKTADTSNKIQLNRTLETNEVPTLWLGNKPWKLDAAVKQRFTYSLFMDTPPTLVRQRIWQRRCQMSNVKLTAGEMLALARAYAAPPRMIAQAIQTFAATGDRKDLEASLDASIMVGSGSELVKLRSPVPANFCEALLTARTLSGRMLCTLRQIGLEERPFHLLMQGVEGSGASTAVRYLAEQINLNPLEVSMADLTQPGMGPPPEVRIAEIFDLAARRNRFLVIDDIEHLLVNPNEPTSTAHKSLTHAFKKAAEAHPLPFAATTELRELSPDIKFLFSDNLRCDVLSASQIKTAYRHFFGHRAPTRLGYPLHVGAFADAANFLRLTEASRADDEVILKRLSLQMPPAHES